MRSKKPYLRRKKDNKVVVMFNQHNHDFGGLIFAYCELNGISCIQTTSSLTGHKRFELSCSYIQARNIGDYIKTRYDEFSYYNKQLKLFIDKIK